VLDYVSTLRPYESGNWRRICDDCGEPRMARDLTKKSDGFWYCPPCANKIPAIELDLRKANGPAGITRPVPDARPNDSVDIDAHVEGRMLKVLDETTPNRYYDVTTSSSGAVVSGTEAISVAAETIRALYNLIVENKRQTVVISRARTILIRNADWLLTKQYGNALASSSYTAASTATEYGAFTASADPTTATIYSYDVGAAGYALCRAYQLTGDGRYRNAYLAALTCMRRLQCGDLRTTNYCTTADQGTGRRKLGYWTHSFIRGSCGTSPVALSSETPASGSTVATLVGGVTIVFASNVTLASFTVTKPGGGAWGSATLTPAAGSTASSFNYSQGGGLVSTPSGVYTAQVVVDSGDPCKAQVVTWTWTYSPGGGG
jgi:hypothetical protein